MKIAIVSEKESLDARMDSRFGRCSYFAIYDTDSKVAIFSQIRQRIFRGRRSGSCKFIASQGVKRVVAPEFGKKAEAMLEKSSN